MCFIKYGNCYTFNPGTYGYDPISINQNGKSHGLQLELFVGKPRIYNSFTNTIGAKIFIYNHSTVYTETDSIEVAVNTDTNIRLTKNIVQKLGRPYSDCVENTTTPNVFEKAFHVHNMTYRHSNCLNLCYQSIVLERCKCVDYEVHFANLLNLELSEPCMTEHLMCLADIHENETHGFYGTCMNLCHKECNEVSYSYMASFGKYPSNSRAQIFKKTSNTFADMEVEEIGDNVLKLNIYFDKMSYHVISESPELTFGTLLANYGGTMGLFLGISGLGFFEILNIIHTIIFYKCNDESNLASRAGSFRQECHNSLKKKKNIIVL